MSAAPVRRLSRVLAACAVASLLGSLSAQSAAFVPFGNPCPADAATLQCTSLPLLGGVLQVVQRSGGADGPRYEGGVAASLIVGLSNTSWRGQPLPMSPAALQAFGIGSCGDLSVAGDLVIAMPFAMPRVQVATDFPIPNQPALLGAHIYLQTVEYWSNLRMQLAVVFGEAGEAIVGR